MNKYDLEIEKIILKNIKLSDHSSYSIGGVAKYFAMPENLNELTLILNFANNSGLRYFIFGMGCNILFFDELPDDVIFISLKKFINFEFKKESIFLSSGIPITYLSIIGLLYNQENLIYSYLLPGCIGGGIYMNAKYLDFQMSNIIDKIIYYNPDNSDILSIKNDYCEFDYKKSIFQKKNWIILGAEIKIEREIELSKKEILNFIFNKNNIENYSNLNYFYNNVNQIVKDYSSYKYYNIIEKINFDRVSKKHFDFPSCGSIFKNYKKIGIPIGKIVDDIGLKGLSYGGAMISPYHGNIIINTGNAKANDVLYLINKIEEEIEKKYNFIPEREIIIPTF